MRFITKKKELLLVHTFDDSSLWTKAQMLEQFKSNEPWKIAHCFSVDKKALRDIPIEDTWEDETVCFCIGTVGDSYTSITPEIIGTKNTFYFANEIPLKRAYFIADRNISILPKIDKVVGEDVYIGGDHEGTFLPLEVFEQLIKNFPKTAELNHYADARIATIIKEFYPHTERYESLFQKYIERKNRCLASAIPTYTPHSIFKDHIEVELAKFKDLQANLIEWLDYADTITEDKWQEQIHQLIRFLNPKYIAGVREIRIKGVDAHDKRPDFLLVDANGYIDILEIKTPNKQLISSLYRNNYVPVRELAGAVQQVEKYIYCLNAWGKAGEENLKEQLSGEIPTSVTPKIINPQGLLLMGRSKYFNEQQKSDFELIKRQYKHIAEIMTYDDLLQRINNIIAALSQQLNAM